MPTQTFGRNVSSTTTPVPIEVLAYPDDTDWKIAGVTIDWSTVAAVGADTTLGDGTFIPSGKKYLRYGQIIDKIKATTGEVQTITVSGTPAGGTYTLSLDGYTTAPITYSGTPATNVTNIQAALDALLAVGVGNSVVAGTGPYTVTFQGRLTAVDVSLLVFGNNLLTGGTNPTMSIATTTTIAASQGMFGPYDSGAADGRQTLVRGECWILNQTVLQDPMTGFAVVQSAHPAVFDGGTVWRDRLLISNGSASLAAGPTVATFETAFPRIQYVQS